MLKYQGKHMQYCPCGTGKSYSDCCGPFISGLKIPVTPEELMRSRYTAYTEANITYITKTMKPPAANNFDETSAREWAERVKWLKLEVISSSLNGTKGFVEFLAYFSDHHKKHVIHEISEFHLIDHVWFYIDGRSPARSSAIVESKINHHDGKHSIH